MKLHNASPTNHSGKLILQVWFGGLVLFGLFSFLTSACATWASSSAEELPQPNTSSIPALIEESLEATSLTTSEPTTSIMNPELDNLGQFIAGDRFGRGTINDIAFHPTKPLLAVAGGLGVWLYDAESLELINHIEGHTGSVTSVAWSPDGMLLASGGTDNTVLLWNPDTGELLDQISGIQQFSHVWEVIWSPDGDRLAIASRGTEYDAVRLWDLVSSQEAALIKGSGFYRDLDWSPDGEALALASAPSTAPGNATGNVQIWQFENTGQPIYVGDIGENGNNVQRLVWSLDSKSLALVRFDTAQVWDLATGLPVSILAGHEGNILTVAWSPDGAGLATAGRDGTLRIWDPGNSSEIDLLQGETGFSQSIAWSADGSLIAASLENHTLIIWDFRSGEPVAIQTDHGDINRVAWSPQGKLLAATSWGRLPTHPQPISNEAVLWLWDTQSGEQVARKTGDTGFGRFLAWSPAGTILATAGHRSSIQWWDGFTGDLIFAINGEAGDPSSVAAIAWSPDGNLLAVGDSENVIELWDPMVGELVASLQSPLQDLHLENIYWSPDGQTLAVSFVFGGRVGGVVQLLDRSTLQPRGLLEGVRGVFGVQFAWSPDGTILATPGIDGSVQLWDVNTGKQMGSFQVNTTIRFSLAWSPSNDILASTGTDGSLHLWNTASGEQIAILENPIEDYSIEKLAWSPDSSMLAVAGIRAGGINLTGISALRIIQVWDVESGTLLPQLSGNEFAWSQDSGTLAVVTGGSVQLWRINNSP